MLCLASSSFDLLTPEGCYDKQLEEDTLSAALVPSENSSAMSQEIRRYGGEEEEEKEEAEAEAKFEAEVWQLADMEIFR